MRGAMVFALSFVRSHGLQRAALRAPTVRGFASRKAATSVAVEAFDVPQHSALKLGLSLSLSLLDATRLAWEHRRNAGGGLAVSTEGIPL